MKKHRFEAKKRVLKAPEKIAETDVQDKKRTGTQTHRNNHTNREA